MDFYFAVINAFLRGFDVVASAGKKYETLRRRDNKYAIIVNLENPFSDNLHIKH